MPPKVLESYRSLEFSFGSRGESREPINVHVFDVNNRELLKVWLTRDGLAIARRDPKVRNGTVSEILDYIQRNRNTILGRWAAHFGNIEFYGEDTKMSRLDFGDNH